jgi:hypothetical protein
LRLIGFYWGILGVTGLIGSAVFRLSPRILELDIAMLGPLHWAALLLFTPYMAYAEGYKGFHLNFAPRVVKRALVLRDGGKAAVAASESAVVESAAGKETSAPLLSPQHQLLLTLLAPLFCMGLVYATRTRLLVSILVTSGIVALVLLVSHAPQPWRGIIDVGVVTGLVIGIGSLLYHWLRFEADGVRPTITADLPR